MKHSLKVGGSFGTVSGVITVLGLIVGLYSTTNSGYIVLGGILIIAVADALSDSLGIHISEESENKHSVKEIWESTVCTFFSKFFVSLSFVIPVMLFELQTAVFVCIFWGLFLLGVLSFLIAREEKTKSWKVVVEHLLIAIVVIIATYYLGQFINSIFN